MSESKLFSTLGVSEEGVLKNLTITRYHKRYGRKVLLWLTVIYLILFTGPIFKGHRDVMQDCVTAHGDH